MYVQGKQRFFQFVCHVYIRLTEPRYVELHIDKIKYFRAGPLDILKMKAYD